MHTIVHSASTSRVVCHNHNQPSLQKLKGHFNPCAIAGVVKFESYKAEASTMQSL